MYGSRSSEDLESRSREDTLTAIFDVLFEEAHRWKTANISITRAHLQRLTTLNFPSTFPVLQFYAPSLHSLRMTNVLCAPNDVLSSLATLELRHIILSDTFLGVLENANVETLRIHNLIGPGPVPSLRHDIVCPARTLEIRSAAHGTPWEPTWLLLGSILMPNLNSLSMAGPDRNRIHTPVLFPAIELEEFLTRSLCNLISLRISLYMMSERDMVHVLEVLPFLTHLSLDDRPPFLNPWQNDLFSKIFFFRMSVPPKMIENTSDFTQDPHYPNFPILVPRLSHLEMYFDMFRDIPEEYFSWMVQSRGKSSSFTQAVSGANPVLVSGLKNLKIRVSRDEVTLVRRVFRTNGLVVNADIDHYGGILG
ncbi:hypothetical protein K435DRAFT_840633 [Dendrothele bispora CBS 962.96]|uniref:F-box domain-containing protein n=1 Tax=Dendrothele bispora (strain CBS 962.96) TaxID=1314807 RepID=A0A4S8LRX0_DENBC|nr:hypothetical protein K435DRAFT_840633 [Dendrothele bispora CBS 962.96]